MKFLTHKGSPSEMLADILVQRRRRPVAVNDKGHVVGEGHHRAILSDHDVDLIWELRAAGVSRAAIAEKFEVSIYTVREILLGRRRAQITVGQRLRRTKV